MISNGTTYEIYTEKTPGTESNVMFIYQTAPIASSSTSTTATDTTESLPWYKKIFKK